MKNLILSAIFAVVAFTSNAQSLMINAYAVKNLSRNDLFQDVRYEMPATAVNIRYIINFSNSKIQKYTDGELVLDTVFTVITELMPYSKQFWISFNDNTHSISLSLQFNDVIEFDVDANMVMLFENYTIY